MRRETKITEDFFVRIQEVAVELDVDFEIRMQLFRQTRHLPMHHPDIRRDLMKRTMVGARRIHNQYNTGTALYKITSLQLLNIMISDYFQNNEIIKPLSCV